MAVVLIVGSIAVLVYGILAAINFYGLAQLPTRKFWREPMDADDPGVWLNLLGGVVAALLGLAGLALGIALLLGAVKPSR